MKELLLLGLAAAAYIYRDKWLPLLKAATGGACCSSCAGGGSCAGSSQTSLTDPAPGTTIPVDQFQFGSDVSTASGTADEDMGLQPLPGESIAASSGNMSKALSSTLAIYGLRTTDPCTGCN